MRNALRVLLALLLVVSATAVWAGETGSVSGFVRDGTGQPVPGANVKITGGQAPRTTVSGPNGAFVFPILLPGTYVVTAELKGLGLASQEVLVLVDNDAQLMLTLVATAKAEVIVTGVSSEIDKKASEVNFNYTASVIKDLPLNRSYQGLLNLTPGSAADTTGYGYVSVSGGTRQDNKYLLDGVNITNPGYGFLGSNTNQLDIVDFNVKKAGISAEFGRTSGAQFNAVTKSGTNKVFGTLLFNASPSAFQADYKNTAQSSSCTSCGAAITQDVSNYNGQANLGFPILRDVLFGYVSGSYSSETTSGRSSTVGGVTITQPDTTRHLGDYFGKLTAFVGPTVLLNGGFRALPVQGDNQFNSIYDYPTAAYKADTTNYIGNAYVDWFASKNTVVEAKYVYYKENDTSQAATALDPFQPTTIDPRNLGAYGAFQPPSQNGGNVGYPEFADTGDKYTRNEVKATLSQYFDLGPTQNQFKLGGGYEDVSMNTVRATSGWGLWTNGTQTCSPPTCSPSVSGTYRTRYYTSQPVQYGKARTYAAFIQDTITWKNLTLYLGVLANKDDFAQICPAGQVCGSATTPPNTSSVRYNFMTFDWDQEIQPRFGLTWAPNLLQADKFYSTYGQYAGVDQKSTSRSFAPFRIRQDQAYFDGTTGAFLGSEFRGSSAGKYIPPDLKPPYYQEWVIGYSAAATKDISFDLYYQYRNLHNAFEDVPINPNNYFGSFQAANVPWARRVYRALTLDVQKRYRSGWYADMNVTFSKLYGNWDEDYDTGLFNTSSFMEDEPGWNSADPNRYGRLGQDRPFIGKLMGSYDFPFGLTFGGFLRIQSGTPWEPRGATPSTTSGRYIGICTANAATGIADCVPAEAGVFRLPTWTNFDLLAAYNFKVAADLTIRLEARVQNLFNTQTAIGVNRIQFDDAYAETSPRSAALTPQRSKQPNPEFGTATTWAPPRRFVLTARMDF